MISPEAEGPQLSALEGMLGDFVVEEEIAHTPRTAIYRISQSRFDRPLALKVAQQAVHGEDLVRFQHEVRLLSEAKHRNVIEVFDFGVLPGSFPFLTMELLSADDLMTTLQEGDWDHFYSLALQAAAGLAHIHRQRIIHLDIKPANLGLIGGNPPTLKILDFGLAQSVRGPLDRKIRGTLAYTAPEVLLQDSYDQRADLYSLGVTLFQLATGVLPSAGDDETAIRFHLASDVPDPQAYRSDMPSQLAAILRQLLQRDPQERFPSAGKLLLELARAAGREIDPASLALGEGRVLSSRMVGRSSLVEELRTILDSEESPAVVLLEGEGGVGKSRLLREFRLLAAMEGVRVGVGRALVARPEPMRPVLDALGQLGLEPGTSSPLGKADVESLGEALNAAEGNDRRVLLLDDLQHADSLTWDFLRWAAQQAPANWTIVGARRIDNDAAVDAVPGAETLELEPLDGESCRGLVDASLGTDGLPELLYQWVTERSGGYPGRVLQLMHHLVEERVLRFRQGEWKPSLPSLNRLAARPEALQVLDRERLAAVSGNEASLLAALAVAGAPVPWRDVAEVLSIKPESVYRSLSLLVERGFVEVVTGEVEKEYGFARPVLEATVYEDLGVERRQDLHRRWAQQLQERDGDTEPTRAIAEHLWHGGEHVAAQPFLRRAAEQASQAFAHREAADLYARLAEVARDEENAEAATEALIQQARALDAAGSSTRALSLYHRLLEDEGGPARAHRGTLCLAACRLHGKLTEFEEQQRVADEGLALGLEDRDPGLVAGLLEAKADALQGLGDNEGAFAAARRGLKLATHRALDRSRGALLDTLGAIERRQGSSRKARFLFRRGLRAAIAAGDQRLVAEVRHHLSELERERGDWEEARHGYEDNLEAAGQLSDPWIELDSLHALAALECRRGEWKIARQPLERSFELRRTLGAREGQTEAWLLMGEIEEMLGDWTQGEVTLRRVFEIHPRDSDHPDRVIAETQLASIARKKGNWIEAEDLARSALVGAETSGDRRLLALGHHQLGLVEKDRGHWAPAAAHLQRGLEVAQDGVLEDLRPRLLYSLGDLALRQGQFAESRVHFEAALALSEKLGMRFEQAKARVGLARLAVAERRKGGGDAHFEEAVRAFGELEIPFEYARALYEWGVRTPDPELAVDRLDRALAAFGRLGAATDYERTRGVIDGIRERGFLESTPGQAHPGIWEVARVVNSTLDLQEVLDNTMDLVLQRLQAERGMVVLVGRISNRLEVAVSRNLDTGQDEETDLSETVVRRVIEDRQPVLAVDALADPRFAGSESIVAAHIVSILCVPLVIRDQLAGAIYVDHRSSQHLFEPRDLEFLLAFADQAAIAIENARLYGELEERRKRLKAENESLRREIVTQRSLGSLIGESAAMAQIKETIERVALSNTTILVRGESGTGKGLVARILHAASPRRDKPFIHFNCAALPETLVESELFGHEKGAFTGAVGRKPGRFELAHGGTIFLDEIGKVSRSVQAKLLRVVEDRRFERVGGTQTLETDVRIVAATNLNLEEAITTGEFREDLYYRLNIIPIILPPLRERKEDIPHLVEHFFDKIRRELGQDSKELSPDVLDLLLAYRWPGNIRELEAAMHRALVLSRSETLTPTDFAWLGGGDLVPVPRASYQPTTPAQLEEGRYQEVVDAFDRSLVEQALATCDGKIREAARFLGIARNTLKAKMKRYGLSRPAAEGSSDEAIARG